MDGQTDASLKHKRICIFSSALQPPLESGINDLLNYHSWESSALAWMRILLELVLQLFQRHLQMLLGVRRGGEGWAYPVVDKAAGD